MSFSEMFSILQRRESEKIVVIKLGIFYIATGKDAVLLHENLGLKCVCYKNNICKIGIPVDSLEKYLIQIEALKYSYIVYDIDKKNKELIKIKEYKGRKTNKTVNDNINCLVCKGVSAYRTEDIYMEAIVKKLKREQRSEQDE